MFYFSENQTINDVYINVLKIEIDKKKKTSCNFGTYSKKQRWIYYKNSK